MRIYFEIPDNLKGEIEENPTGLNLFRGSHFWNEAGINVWTSNASSPDRIPTALDGLAYRFTERVYVTHSTMESREHGIYKWGGATATLSWTEKPHGQYMIDIDSTNIKDLWEIVMLIKTGVLKPLAKFQAKQGEQSLAGVVWSLFDFSKLSFLSKLRMLLRLAVS